VSYLHLQRGNTAVTYHRHAVTGCGPVEAVPGRSHHPERPAVQVLVAAGGARFWLRVDWRFEPQALVEVPQCRWFPCPWQSHLRMESSIRVRKWYCEWKAGQRPPCAACHVVLCHCDRGAFDAITAGHEFDRELENFAKRNLHSELNAISDRHPRQRSLGTLAQVQVRCNRC
jgi:hypothetical protein